MPGKTKVFVADGSPISISRILNLLAYCGNVEIVGFANDSSNTLLSLRVLKPDVLIMDIEIKGASGLQLLKSVKKEFPELVIIVLTNASQNQYRKSCVEAGANHFFDKSSQFWKINDILSPFPNPYQV